jgi:hypothetical protein
MIIPIHISCLSYPTEMHGILDCEESRKKYRRLPVSLLDKKIHKIVKRGPNRVLKEGYTVTLSNGDELIATDLGDGKPLCHIVHKSTNKIVRVIPTVFWFIKKLYAERLSQRNKG